MSIRVVLHCVLKGLKHQRIVVAVTNHVTDDSAVIEVQNGAKIYLVYLNALIPFEFRYVGKPLFIRFIRIELSVEQILGYVLWALCLPRAAVAAVLDGRLNAFGAADTQNAFVIDIYIVVMPQFVVDAPVALVRALRVNLLDLFRKHRVLYSPGTQFAGCPLIVCRARNTQQTTGFVNGLPVRNLVFLYCPVDVALSYLSVASLLTISSNFFSSRFSTSARCS